MRIKGKLGSGKELEQTILQPPGAYPQSGGTSPIPPSSTTTPPPTPATITAAVPLNVFGATGDATTPTSAAAKPFGTAAKTSMNLLGEVEKWGISPGTKVTNVHLNASRMTGAQLAQLVKNLPDGVTYSLDLEAE
jgi:hypothetical protein